MSWFRLGTLTAGSLATTVLLIVITIYTLSLRRKTPDTWFLAGYLGSLTVLLLAYTLRYSILAPAALVLTQVSNLIVFGVVSLVQFAYHYGGNTMPKESRVALALSSVAALAIWVGNLADKGAELIYDFEAEYYSVFYGPWVGVLTLTGYLWAAVVLLRKWLRLRSTADRDTAHRRNTASTRSFALLTLATTVLAATYLLFQVRLIARVTYALVSNTGSLIICLLIFLTYVSSAAQPSTYLARLTGVPLAAILVTLGLVPTALTHTFLDIAADRYERQTELALRSLDETNRDTGTAEVAYILDLPTLDVRYTAAEVSPDAARRAGGARGVHGAFAGGSAPPVFVMLDVRDPRSFYFHYDRAHGAGMYRVGFSYDVYRLALHNFVSILAIAIVGAACVLLLILPLVFERSLLMPLRALLGAVRQVERGIYDTALPLASADEVGDLARGYNRMVDALRGAEGNFRALAENANDAILLLSADGVVEYANNRASAISGYTRQELTGLHLREFLPGAELPAIETRLRARIAGEYLPPAMETVILTRTGAPLSVEVSGGRTVWRDRPAVVVVLRDISERRRAEDSLRRQHDRLAKAERLAALGALVAGVAHEISTPNQVVGLGAKYLEDAVEDLFQAIEETSSMEPDTKVAGLPYTQTRAAMSAAAQRIRDSALRIDRIVSELRDSLSGATRVNREPTDINGVVRSVATLAQHLIGKATDRFSLGLAEGLPPISADPIGMEQVVMNLVRNACDALPDRGRAVEVRTRLDPSLGALVVEVRDEGVGIPPEIMEHLTEEFFTTRTEQGGTGLGLSISGRIVREHGGTLKFSSKPGSGTTVTVTLPVAAAGTTVSPVAWVQRPTPPM